MHSLISILSIRIYIYTHPINLPSLLPIPPLLLQAHQKSLRPLPPHSPALLENLNQGFPDRLRHFARRAADVDDAGMCGESVVDPGAVLAD